MIGSLNCRSLSKPHNPNKRQHFIRFLRTTQLGIITFQETHANGLEIQQTLDTLLQTKSSCWSSHCGIVSLNANILITPIFISIDQRVILSLVEHNKQSFDPILLG